MLGESSPQPGLQVARREDLMPAAITDIGCEREINEDRYAVIDSAAGRAWIVCDGMGGVAGGELAAQLAIDAIRRTLDAHGHDTSAEALAAAIEEANRVIVLRRQNPAFSAMGTTVVGVIVQEDELVLAHAGDSRAYIIRKGEIQQLTVDHTYVQELVDKQQITEEAALSHPQAHVLTRCLGADPRLRLDSQQYWLWNVDDGPGDYLLLCSDGLYSLVSNDEISQIITEYSPQEACVKLVELAKNRGGFDNITIAILPLHGELHEESPAGKDVKPRSTRRQEIVEAPRLPLGKRIGLMLALFLLGIFFTLLVMLTSA